MKNLQTFESLFNNEPSQWDKLITSYYNSLSNKAYMDQVSNDGNIYYYNFKREKEIVELGTVYIAAERVSWNKYKLHFYNTKYDNNTIIIEDPTVSKNIIKKLYKLLKMYYNYDGGTGMNNTDILNLTTVINSINNMNI